MTLISRIVLIVEDDAIIALELRDIALGLGWRVAGPFSSLSEGDAHAKVDELDFALLDFNLGDGVDAVRIAESLTARGVRFAFVSGSNPADILESVPSARIIGKPFIAGSVESLLRDENGREASHSVH